MLSSQLANLPRPISRIIHIGAGTGADLSDYLAAGVEAVLLVEAHADTAAELAAQTAREPRVETLQAAVSGDLQHRPFFRTNFPELDSLRAPTEELRILFPGMRLLSDKTTVPSDPVELLRDRPPATEGSQVLVLETPGESLSILRSLEAADLLHSFDVIALREGRQPLYDGAPSLEQIRSRLDATDFLTTIEPLPEDPERPWLFARLNRIALDLRQTLADAQAQIASITEERDSARNASERNSAELADAQAQIASITEERDSARNASERNQQKIKEEVLKAEGQIRLLQELLMNKDNL